VVRIEPGRNFVVADLPGLIEGAAQGAGLGHRFLRHLARTRILLHLVDMAPPEPAIDPVTGIKAIEAELSQFGARSERGKVLGATKPAISRKLHRRERWLVLNKMDLLPEDERESRVRQLVKKLKWKGPVYRISAINREGCRELVLSLMQRLENMKKKTKHKSVTRNG
jgi:GTP-binding protein